MCLDLFSEGALCGWILVSDHLVSSFWVVAYGPGGSNKRENGLKLATSTYTSGVFAS